MWYHVSFSQMQAILDFRGQNMDETLSLLFSEDAALTIQIMIMKCQISCLNLWSMCCEDSIFKLRIESVNLMVDILVVVTLPTRQYSRYVSL